MNEIREHQVQLRTLREPPEFLRAHPLYDMVRMEDSRGFGGMSVDSEHEVEKEDYSSPCTRSRGRVQDYEWIINKGC